STSDVGKVEEISPRAAWIQAGRIRMDGPTASVVARYLEPNVSVLPMDRSAPGGASVRLAAVHLLDGRGDPATSYRPGDPIAVVWDLETDDAIELPYLQLGIASDSGPITAANMFVDGHRPRRLAGSARIECRFEAPSLAPRHQFMVRFAMYASDG